MRIFVAESLAASDHAGLIGWTCGFLSLPPQGPSTDARLTDVLESTPPPPVVAIPGDGSAASRKALVSHRTE